MLQHDLLSPEEAGLFTAKCVGLLAPLLHVIFWVNLSPVLSTLPFFYCTTFFAFFFVAWHFYCCTVFFTFRHLWEVFCSRYFGPLELFISLPAATSLRAYCGIVPCTDIFNVILCGAGSDPCRGCVSQSIHWFTCFFMVLSDFKYRVLYSWLVCNKIIHFCTVLWLVCTLYDLASWIRSMTS